MKRTFLFILAVALSAIFTPVSGLLYSQQATESYLSTLPAVSKHILKNDVRLLYIKDELPRTVIYAAIPFGKIYEDSSNAGISEMIARTISVSGSINYPGNAANQKLENIGGAISVSAGWENIVIEIKVLARYTDIALNIMGDMLQKPLLDGSGMELARRLVLEKLKRDMDNPADRAFYKLREILFDGKGYGSVPTEKSISGITADSMRGVWGRFVRGANLSIAVLSSMSENDILSVSAKELAGIGSGGKENYSVDRESVLAELKGKSSRIYLIPSELEQATIVTGTLAPEIKYQGNYALYMMNYILGGGSFNSRLMSEIRVKRGLAYSAFSLVKNRRGTGIFMTFVQTRNDSVSQVISLLDENIKKMRDENVGMDELEWSKQSVTNSYVFRFSETEDVLLNYLDMEYNELDADYYRNYPGMINRVTADQIRLESGKLFDQGRITVIVGDRKLEKELSRFGKVVVVE